jgi:ABC-type methionine transport system permease subunit
LTSDVAIDADATKDADAPLVSSRAVLWGNLDLLLVAAAVVPALALGAPETGLLFGAGGWILQRLVAVFDRRWIRKASDPVKQVAANLFEAFGRIWLLAAVIVLASVVGERSDGLTASVVILAAYSVAFVVRLMAGPPARRKAAE